MNNSINTSTEEPPFDCEDKGCLCTEAGIESDWQWNEANGVYVCSGCGAVQ